MSSDLDRRVAALGFNVDPINIYGPFVVSQFVNLPLLGICWCTGWTYYTTQPKDKLIHKLVVAALLILTTLDAGFACSRLIKTAVLHGGDLLYFIDIGKRFEDWSLELLITGQCIIAQAFMVWRAIAFAQAMKHVYNRRIVTLVWITSALLVAGLLFCAAWGLRVAIYLSGIQSYAQVVSSSSPRKYGSYTFLTDVQISAFLGLDVLITLTTTAELLMARTGFGASNAVLDILISTMLTNGLLVTVLQMSILLTFHLTISTWGAFPRGFLGKIHTLTIISILIRPKMALSKYNAKIDRESDPTACEAKRGRPSTSNHETAKTTSMAASDLTSRCPSCGVDSGATMVRSLTSPIIGMSRGIPGAPEDKSSGQDGLGITILRKEEIGDGGMMGFRAALLDLEECGSSDELDSKNG